MPDYLVLALIISAFIVPLFLINPFTKTSNNIKMCVICWVIGFLCASWFMLAKPPKELAKSVYVPIYVTPEYYVFRDPFTDTLHNFNKMFGLNLADPNTFVKITVMDVTHGGIYWNSTYKPVFELHTIEKEN